MLLLLRRHHFNLLFLEGGIQCIYHLVEDLGGESLLRHRGGIDKASLRRHLFLRVQGPLIIDSSFGGIIPGVS